MHSWFDAGLQPCCLLCARIVSVVYLPLAINSFLQDRQLEVLDGNLIHLLLPLTEALLLIRQHGPGQGHVLDIHLHSSSASDRYLSEDAAQCVLTGQMVAGMLAGAED